MTGETQLTIVGSLTADPELRYTQSGLAVANFTIASNSRTFDRTTNDWKDEPAMFLRCSVWREFAEHVSGSLAKGTRVMAIGNLKQRGYETKEGEKRTSFELEILEIGPTLRFATAAVTRVSSGSRTQARHEQERDQQGWATAPPTDSGDVWNTPGDYRDETPF